MILAVAALAALVLGIAIGHRIRPRHEVDVPWPFAQPRLPAAGEAFEPASRMRIVRPPDEFVDQDVMWPG